MISYASNLEYLKFGVIVNFAVPLFNGVMQYAVLVPYVVVETLKTAEFFDSTKMLSSIPQPSTLSIIIFKPFKASDSLNRSTTLVAPFSPFNKYSVMNSPFSIFLLIWMVEPLWMLFVSSSTIPSIETFWILPE